MNLETLPIPVDTNGMARAKVTTLPDGSWTLAWALEGGLRVVPFGDPFPGPRAACKAAARINARSGS